MEIKLTKGNSLYGKRLLLIIMRTFIFLCCATVFALTPNNLISQHSKIEIAADESLTVDEVFDLIMEQTEYKFFYEEGIFMDFPKVEVKKGRIRTNTLLKQSLLNRNLNIEITKNNAILISEKFPNSILEDPKNKEIQIGISGTITDENGTPLPGANILEKGTTNGTQADFDGDFSIQIKDENAILVISYIGFATEEIAISGRTNIVISLQEDSATLEEVVVVGFGTRDRKTLAGSVQTVKSEVFEGRSLANALSALQGTAPGLVVTQNSAQPGSEGFNLRVRGPSSAAGIVNNSDSTNPDIVGGTVGPLVLVDGIQSDFSTVNPNDIENISILKDGSAAIYGNQAANGVILITTKKGKKGKLKVSYETSYGINSPTEQTVKLGIREFLNTTNEASANDLDPIFWGQKFYDAIGTDQVLNFSDWELGGAYRADSWLTFNNPENELNKLVFGTGDRQIHNLNISGGGDKSNYYFSLGYLKEKGVVNTEFDKYKRYNVRLNYTFNISDRLKLTTQNVLELGNQSINSELASGAVLDQIERNIPFFPLRRPDGEYYRFRGFNNPLQLLEEGRERTQYSNRIISNYQLDFDITNQLSLTANAGINNRDIRIRNPRGTIGIFNTYSPEFGGDGNGGYANGGTDPGPTAFINNPNSLTERFERQTFISYNAYLNYKKLFADLHNVEISAGFSHEQQRNNFISSFISDFPTNDLFALNLGNQDNARVNQGIDTWTVQGLFGRLNYTLANKYILEANIRRDASSRFDADDRAGVFSGYLAAWRASEEKFIEKLGIFDNLKFRVSYGETGNQNGIGLYDYLSLINNNITNPVIFGPATGNENAGGNPDCTTCGLQQENPYYTEAGVVSNERTWETVETTNFGVDVGVLDNRLNFSFDYYTKNNDNMLVPVTLPAVLGSAPPTLNIGKLETKGWEFQINWNDHIGDFNYYLGGALFDYENKLVDLNGGATRRAGINNFIEGYSLGTYFGFKYDGIIQNEQELEAYRNRFPDGGTPNLNAGLPGSLAIGDAKYADLDGNGQLSALGNPEDGDTGDLVELGNVAPRYSFNVTFGGDYKGFDFRMLFQGVGKRTIFKTGYFSSPINNGQWFYPGLKYYSGRTWTPENTEAQFPALSIRKNNYNYEVSENTKLNGAYMRLKNLQFGYSLPQDIMGGIGIDKLRLYVSGENIFELHGIDKALNFDPEAGTTSLSYPFVRTYALGLQVSF